MPLSLPPLSRRRWIRGGLAAASAALIPEGLPAQAPKAGKKQPPPGEAWVLFSDTHVPADAKQEARGVCMGDNLTRCVNQVLKLAGKPYGVLVNGDCAYLDGQEGDYATFVDLIRPLREAGLQVHCTLGNHDDRKNFIAALTSVQDPRPVEGKHVSVISSATMNWVLLDSLEEVNKTPGSLGDLQRGWLDRTLASLPNRPTVVMAHHNPQEALTEGQKATGLKDSDPMFEVLARHKKVKAFVYGHTHSWSHRKHEATGLDLVNLPPVAFVFSETRPNGWVLARATPEKLVLELRALNPAHDLHGEKVEIAWGAA